MSETPPFWRGWAQGTRRAYGIALLFSAGGAMPDRLPWWVPVLVAGCYAVAVVIEKRARSSAAPA